MSSENACALSLGNKVILKMVLNEYNEYKKQYEKDQQTIISFDKLYRKSLQGNIIDKSEFESFCNIFSKYLDEPKNEFFYKHEHENQNKIFQ